VVNALVGIMTQQGLTSPSLPAPIPEWRGATDPRCDIGPRGRRSMRPTAASIHRANCAGFWTNRSEHRNAGGRVRLGIPRDAFFASGDLGQRIVIMPSQHLVVVRLGDSVDPTGEIRGLGGLVKEVIAAKP
jgi:CubicO group peptidase (beta-lactamase class C family)